MFPKRSFLASFLLFSLAAACGQSSEAPDSRVTSTTTEASASESTAAEIAEIQRLLETVSRGTARLSALHTESERVDQLYQVTLRNLTRGMDHLSYHLEGLAARNPDSFEMKRRLAHLQAGILKTDIANLLLTFPEVMGHEDNQRALTEAGEPALAAMVDLQQRLARVRLQD